MQQRQSAVITRDLARALLLGVAVIAGASALGSTGADAQPLTKEQIEEMKRRQQQKQPPQQQQQPQRQFIPKQQQSPPPVVKREAPPVVKREPPPPPKSFTPPPVVKRDTPPPPPPVVKRDVTPPPPPVVKRDTPPPPALPPAVKRDTTIPPANKGFVTQQPLTKGATPPPPPIRKVDPIPGTPPPAIKNAVPVPPSGTTTVPPPGGQTGFKTSPRVIGVSPTGQVLKPGTPNVGRKIAPVTDTSNITQLQSSRVRTTDTRGRQVIQEPGNRTIIKQGNVNFIHRSEPSHIKHYYPNARTTPLPNGIAQTVYVRPDGVRIFTETDRSGRIIRRFGRRPGGRDIIYVDNRRFYRNLAIGAGVAAIGVGVALALAPPVLAMPRERYIIDYDRASDDDIYEALSAPPIERLERGYSLDEIRYNDNLRARMRRVDVDSITFDTGSFVVTEEQYPKLERIARAIARVIERDPAEMFLIEGHTDAVGNDEDNLSLSDRRAEAVAQVLTDYYSIPLENIVTQGYGEQHLKVNTQDPERINRRVSMRRITPLLSKAD